MSAAANPELVRAYQLIESDDLEKARSLLDSYLEQDRDNADAWWLYAHAVNDPMEAQDALRNVLRLDPAYPGAKALLTESEQLLTPAKTAAPATPLQRLGSRPVPDDRERTPDFLDQLDIDEGDDFDAFDSDEDELQDRAADDDDDNNTRLRRILFVVAATILALIVIGIGFVLTNPLRNRTAQPPATNVAGESTATAVSGVADADLTPFATQNVTQDSTADVSAPTGFENIIAGFSAFTLAGDGVGVEETSLGSTLIASVCNDPSRGLAATTLEAVDTLSRQTDIGIPGTAYIGVRVVDCARGNLPLRTVAVSTADASAFAAGILSFSEFRAQLQPIETP